MPLFARNKIANIAHIRHSKSDINDISDEIDQKWFNVVNKEISGWQKPPIAVCRSAGAENKTMQG
jgi:hypothetical protein